MKLFRHSQGFLVAFGMNMTTRKPDPHMICWSDPESHEWEMDEPNLAGWNRLPFTVDPEFVRECDGAIVAYQPGRCIEMWLIGGPLVWSFRVLAPDAQKITGIAA